MVGVSTPPCTGDKSFGAQAWQDRKPFLSSDPFCRRSLSGVALSSRGAGGVVKRVRREGTGRGVAPPWVRGSALPPLGVAETPSTIEVAEQGVEPGGGGKFNGQNFT